MSAVASGDADAAVELSRQHREHALEALCDALPAETDQLPGATAQDHPPPESALTSLE